MRRLPKTEIFKNLPLTSDGGRDKRSFRECTSWIIVKKAQFGAYCDVSA